MNHLRSPGKLSWLNSISTFVRGSDADELVPSRSANSKHLKKMAPKSFLQQVVFETRMFFFGSKLNVVLLVIPFAVISKAVGWGDGPTCALSMVALIPLAERLGYVTEQLAMYTNDSIGGLLNATFGNATELIISAFALKANLLRVVQLSLLGSVVSNLLLVMGTAFLAGGIFHASQTFSREAIAAHCALLLLSVIAMLLPTMLVMTRTQSNAGRPGFGGEDVYPIGSSSLILSRIESLMMFGCYILFLIFQLCTHKHLYEGLEEEASTPLSRAASGRPSASRRDRDMELTEVTGSKPPPLTASASGRMSLGSQRTASGRPISKRPDGEIDEASVPLVLGAGIINSTSRPDLEGGDGDGDGNGGNGGPALHTTSNGLASIHSAPGGGGSGGGDDEEQELSRPGCFFWMALVTAAISLLSEWVVGAIEGASKDLGVPLPFLVTILLPIVGNAAEHASAVLFAMRNRMELALGVAVGSSTQVSVLLVPFSVILAWMMGRPLDLNLSAFEAAVLFVSVLLSIVMLQDGSSNWLKGVMLMMTYVFVAAGFWCHQDETLDAEERDGPPAASRQLLHMLVPAAAA